MSKINEEIIIIMVAALSQFTVHLIANMATIIIPEIAMELNIGADFQLWINLIFLCTLIAVAIPLAKVMAAYGLKKSLKVTFILLIISLLMVSFSVNFYMILLGRLIQGMCHAAMTICAYAMLVEELDDEPLGTALGIVSSCGYIGLMMAPSVTGFISNLFGWRMPFLLLVPLYIFQLFLLSRIKSEWVLEEKPTDLIGSIICMSTMVLFTIGLTFLDTFGVVPLIVTVILFVLFYRYEKRLDHPIIDINLFKNLRFVIGNYSAMVTYFVTTIATTVLTYHLIYILDLDMDFICTLLLVTPIVMIFVSVISGKLSSRHDPRVISGLALVALLFSNIMVAYLIYLTIPLIIVACIFQGLGHGFFSSPNNKYVLTLVDEEDLGDASALLALSKSFGRIFSTAIYTLLFSIVFGNIVLKPGMYNYLLYNTNFVMMVITCFITVTGIVLLFYSKYRYEQYENPAIVRLANRLKSKWFRDRGY